MIPNAKNAQLSHSYSLFRISPLRSRKVIPQDLQVLDGRQVAKSSVTREDTKFIPPHHLKITHVSAPGASTTKSSMNSMMGANVVTRALSGRRRSLARYLKSSMNTGRSVNLPSMAFSKITLLTVSGTGPLGSSSKDCVVSWARCYFLQKRQDEAK